MTLTHTSNDCSKADTLHVTRKPNKTVKLSFPRTAKSQLICICHTEDIAEWKLNVSEAIFESLVVENRWKRRSLAVGKVIGLNFIEKNDDDDLMDIGELSFYTIRYSDQLPGPKIHVLAEADADFQFSMETAFVCCEDVSFFLNIISHDLNLSPS